MGGMTRLLLLLWAGVTVGSLVDLQKRIIGGHDCTKDDKRGYHVFLTFKDGTRTSVCSGSLISDQWILTAAHCWKPGRTVTAVFGRDPKSGNEMTLGPEHEIFKDKKGREHDIMLLKLPDTTDTTGILPVPLPLLADCANKPKPNVDEVQIAGYASTAQPNENKKETHKRDKSKPLQCANTTVVECTKCEGKRFEYPHLLCYQDDEVDTTGGDSGGGVVFNGKIYGVHVRSKKIACSGPARSMDVCAKDYIEWIYDTAIDPTQKCDGCFGFLKNLCPKRWNCFS